MMKARQYDRRILTQGMDPHIYSIQESNTFNRAHLKYFGGQTKQFVKNDALTQITGLLDAFKEVLN